MPDPADTPGERGTERLTISPGGYRRIVAVALALLCIIVVSGAAVRLTGSGLGCSDWPNCEDDRFIAVTSGHQAVEQINRLFTGLVSLSVMAAVLGSLRRRPYRRDLVWLSLGLVAGVVGQIVLGGITVLVDLHPAAVAGHFVLSMLLVADAVVLLWRAGRPAGPRTLLVDRTDLWLSRAVVATASLLMVTGPAVTGSGPHAGDEAARRFPFFIPEVVRVHSLNMWVFLALVVVLLVRLRTRGAPAGVQTRGLWLLVVVVAQGAVGYSQYALGIPPWLVALHIAGATAVLSLAIWFHLGLSAPAGAGVAGRSTPSPVPA